MREKITECPLAETCDANCFDPSMPPECREWYNPEEVLRYLSFIFGHAPVLGGECSPVKQVEMK